MRKINLGCGDKMVWQNGKTKKNDGENEREGGIGNFTWFLTDWSSSSRNFFPSQKMLMMMRSKDADFTLFLFQLLVLHHLSILLLCFCLVNNSKSVFLPICQHNIILFLLYFIANTFFCETLLAYILILFHGIIINIMIVSSFSMVKISNNDIRIRANEMKEEEGGRDTASTQHRWFYGMRGQTNFPTS